MLAPLLLVMAAGQTSASPQCGLKSGFERPEQQKEVAQACAKQNTFITIEESMYFARDMSNYLPGSESCETFTSGSNPNCVKSKGHSHSTKFPQCLINFNGRRVKIGSVEDNPNNWAKSASNAAFISEGCNKINSYSDRGEHTPTAFKDDVLSGNLFFTSERYPKNPNNRNSDIPFKAPAWSMCFTETKEPLSACYAGDLDQV